MNPAPGDGTGSVSVVRVIGRLNIGGPAIQAITLTRHLEPLGYRSVLVRGREAPEEGTMDHLAAELDVQPLTVSSMHRDLGPRDLLALAALVRVMRRHRPKIVHTHAAKGGTLGRLAALIAAPRGCVIVHTFHGHSLAGYFSGPQSALFLRIERFLARRTTRLIAVSEEVRDDLVRFGVAPADSFEVIPLGFDLSPFVVDDATRARARSALRAELGISEDEQVVTLIARLVPIKRVDRFLRVAARLGDRPGLRFLIVGDGELGSPLRSSSEAKALGDKLLWAGFRRDIPAVCFASDVVVLTSDNEGTPVSLIEAQAAGVPVVSTAVGGVASVVRDGVTGWLAPPEDESALAAAIGHLLDDPEAATEMGARGRGTVTERYSLERLVDDLDRCYRSLLEDPAAVGQPG